MCVKFISVVVLYCWLHLSVVVPDGNYKSDAENLNTNKGDFAYPDDLDIRKLPKQNLMFHHHHSDFYYHHHHHHPDFHIPDDFADGESGQETFDDTSEENEFRNGSMQIPLDYIQDLNQYNVTDLLLNFVEGDVEEPFIINRFGDDAADARDATVMAKGAECLPEVKTVKITSTDDPTILYIPQCTRIERCGGCCKHDLLSCQALKKESVPFKVYKTQYTGEKKLKFLGSEVIMVEKHNKCKCQCRVQPEDCTKFQDYRETECRCACKNHDEKKKCHKLNETKLWNPELCSCQCRESIQCSTGSYFDQNECRCVALPLNRRVANFQRRSYRSEPLPVVPLDEDY